MSHYNEEAKDEIAEAVKNHVVQNFRISKHDIEVYPNRDHESYVTIEIDHNAAPDNFSWDMVNVRGVVRSDTDYLLDLLDTQGNTLRISPEER